jgi:beta-glucosidase
MCAYNKVNGDYSCENDYLLNQVLKKEWGFQGWVLSDWGGTHSTTKAALNGLDQEMPGDRFFGAPLEKAVDSREVPEARLNDMVHRILRSMFACGVIDNPPVRSVVDPFQGLEDAQHIAEESIVLLKNDGDLLPLDAARVHVHCADRIACRRGRSLRRRFGAGGPARRRSGHPPEGRLAVDASGLVSVFAPEIHPRQGAAGNRGIQRWRRPGCRGQAGEASQVAIVFVNQYMSEGRDAATLSLPDNQDALVSAVAAANPHTIVVIESGGPVSMPWVGNVKGVLEAWYPGIGGAQALAAILFGDVNPSAKLPVTFAKSDADLPHPEVPGIDLKPANRPPPFDVNYTEGLKVGYKWFEAEHKQPLFPFGYGLSYTTFAYSALKADGGARTVSFSVKNTGRRAGAEVAQVYVMLPSAAGEPFKRLIAWERVPLKAGESKTVTLPLDPLYLSIFNAEKDGWELVAGDYKAFAGPLTSAFHIGE